MPHDIHRARLIQHCRSFPFWEHVTNAWVRSAHQGILMCPKRRPYLVVVLSEHCPGCLNIMPSLSEVVMMIYRQNRYRVGVTFVDDVEHRDRNRVMAGLQQITKTLKSIPCILEFDNAGQFVAIRQMDELKATLERYFKKQIP